MMLTLTDTEKSMLAGKQGRAVQRAMEIVETLGRVYGASRLLPVESVQVAGVSYRNLGEAGLSFIQDWASEGARVCVPTTLNPAGMDMRDWQRMGFSAAFASHQQATIEAYVSMGIQPTCTCTPYLVGNLPGLGEHIAWSESSAVAFANSVLGARTNREGGPSALASAVCGRTADYGLHTDAGRRATHLVEVRCPVHEPHEFAALGYIVGKLAGNGVPYVKGLELSGIDFSEEGRSALVDSIYADSFKLLGAALASSGAVALYHLQGITPEARERKDLLLDKVIKVTVDSLEPAYAALNASEQVIDLVVIGCPHASLQELRAVADAVEGQTLSAMLWVTTSRQVKDRSVELGYVEAIERAGGMVVADGCVVVAPMSELNYHSLATNSAKMAAYALPHSGLLPHLGSLQQCIEAAVSGRWSGCNR